MQTRTAVVTGAFGFIGSVLCKLLKEEGYVVFAVDHDQRQFDNFYSKGYFDDYAVADFASPDVLNTIFRSYQDATVFHLAASSLLGPSAYEPLTYFSNNTAKTLKLLETLRPTNKLVFASTAAVYGIQADSKDPITEDSTINPPNNYGLSKLWCEQMIDSYHELGGIKAASFRFFNVIGAYEDTGQQPNTPHVVNQLIDKAFTNTKFELYGTDYPTYDGTCVRDYFHVRDVCRALIHADKYLDKKKKSCHYKFNLGSGEGYTVRQIIDSFQRVTGQTVKVKEVKRRVGDPPYLLADPNCFINTTKFKYNHSSDLDEMILSAWEYRKRDNNGRVLF